MKLSSVVLATCLFCYTAAAQDAALRAPAALPDAAPAPVAHSPDLLVAVLADTVPAADADSIRAFLAGLQQGLKSGGSMRLAIIAGRQVSTAGPFRSVTEVRAALRDVSFGVTAESIPGAAKYYTDLAQLLRSAPQPESFGYMLLLGNPPPFEPGAFETISYTTAWLTRELVSQKRSLLLRSGDAWLQDVARLTGGLVLDKASDMAGEVMSGSTVSLVDWKLKPPTRGFRLDTVASFSAPAIAGKPVTPADFGELRAFTARGDYEKALAINPADTAALRIGIETLEHSPERAHAMPLLEMMTELEPAQSAWWLQLGGLKYEARDFAGAEPALSKAREAGAHGAQLFEQLARIRYAAQDYRHAAELLDESLKADSKQQDLWFLLADASRQLSDDVREAAALERAVALGGPFIDRRERLVRIYLARHQNLEAARAADAALPSLDRNADALERWAGFYRQLERIDDALSCWKRTIALDAKRESAHAGVTAIYLDRKQYTEALAAADAGLEVAAGSPRLQYARASSLERLDRIYESRRALEEFAGASSDLKLLALNAQVSDVWGAGGAAWKRFAEASIASGSPAADRDLALRRGLTVSLRDRDDSAAGWFQKQLGSEAAAKKPGQGFSVTIPGGREALMFIAQGQPGVPPERFFAEFCRTVLAHEPSNLKKEAEAYQKPVLNYFEQLNALLALSKRGAGYSSITVSMANKAAAKQTEAVLNILGWKLRRNRDRLTLQSGEKGADAAKQELASALQIDQAGMQEALQKGSAYEIRIEWQNAALPVAPELLRTAFAWEKLPGGLPEALVRDRDLAMLLSGLGSVDGETLTPLMSGVGLKQLSSRWAAQFSLYASALSVRSGRVIAPGGIKADAVWTKLAGAAPSDPPRFIRALFEKDDGKLLVFWFVLSQLDADHQRFVTLTEHRLLSFYALFRESPDMQGGSGSLARNGSFAGFLREIPLENGSVAFPGSPEVWMVAKGVSKSTANAQKMLRKAHKKVAPDVEDEILLRIAGTRYKNGFDHASEAENFLAVARIEAHRDDPLSDESALLLAQHYALFAPVYPYFAAFADMTAADFHTFFDWGLRLNAMPEVEANVSLGLFYSTAEVIRLAKEMGGMPAADGNAVFRRFLARFAAAQDAAGAQSSALDAVRELDAAAKAPAESTDRAIEALVTGDLKAVTVEWKGIEHSFDAGKRRAADYARVIDAQKAPSLAAMLEIDSAARGLASHTAAVAASIAALDRAVKQIPFVPVGKEVKLEGHSKQDVARDDPAHLAQLVAELKQRAAKKKPDPQDFEKIARQILNELAPQVRLALCGVVYAAYLSPSDALVADDPLLLRKHQFFELMQLTVKKPRFVTPVLVPKSAGAGSYFMGGFAGFAHAAGHSATVATRSGNTDADVYAAQLAAVRLTPWGRFTDGHQQLLGLKLRVAAEWCVVAADDPAMLNALGEETSGILSIARRRNLLAAVAAHDWSNVWANLTSADRLFLADRYLARFEKSPWGSPLDAPLRRLALEYDETANELAGPALLTLNGCDHPHLAALAPYEEYERHLFPAEIAERVAEFKIYLADVMDRMAMPAAAMASIAEPAMRASFQSIKMSDQRDWAAVLRGYAAMDEKQIEGVMETLH